MERERLGLRSNRHALPSVASFVLTPIHDCLGAELVGQGSVVGAEIAISRDGSALATVAELCDADRCGRGHALSVARRCARARARARARLSFTFSDLRQIAVPMKLTVAECVVDYLAHLDSLVAAGERAERTVERYRSHLEGHVVPVLGHRQIQRVNADHVAELIRIARARGLAPWTIKGMLTPLADLCARVAARDHHREPVGPNYRNVSTRGLDKAADAANLNAPGGAEADLP